MINPKTTINSQESIIAEKLKTERREKEVLAKSEEKTLKKDRSMSMRNREIAQYP